MCNNHFNSRWKKCSYGFQHNNNHLVSSHLSSRSYKSDLKDKLIKAANEEIQREIKREIEKKGSKSKERILETKTSECTIPFLDKQHVLTKKFATDNKLPYQIVKQEQRGDLVIVFPGGVHSVRDAGYHFALAGNFAYTSWFETSMKHKHCFTVGKCVLFFFLLGI